MNECPFHGSRCPRSRADPRVDTLSPSTAAADQDFEARVSKYLIFPSLPFNFEQERRNKNKTEKEKGKEKERKKKWE